MAKKKLQGWEQPEEKLPETIEEKNVPQELETEEKTEPKCNLEEEFPDTEEARKYLEAKRAAELIVEFSAEEGLEFAEEMTAEAKGTVAEADKKEPEIGKKEPEIGKKEAESGKKEPEIRKKEAKNGKKAARSGEAGNAGSFAGRAQAKSHGGSLRTMQHAIWARRSHGYAAPLGFAFIVLAIIGLIAVVLFCINITSKMVDNTKEKTAFEWRIYPILMFDPAAFDSPTQLDEAFVLKTALWKTLMDNRTKYTYNDQGLLLVPASDLDVAAKSMYGDAIELSHQSFSEGYEFFYLYDEKQKAYSVPVQGQTAQYSPRVIKIIRNEDIFTLLVGYVPPNNLWNIDTEGNMSEPAPSKYMYYDLQRTESGAYHILSVREVPKNELPKDLPQGQQQLNQTRYESYISSSSGAESEVPQESSEAESSAKSALDMNDQDGDGIPDNESSSEQSEEESAG